MSRISWKRRTDRISLRIIGTVVLTVLAVQLVSAGLFLSHRRPDVSMYSGPWLIDRIAEAVAYGRSDSLDVALVDSLSTSGALPWPHQLLQRQIVDRLSAETDAVIIVSTLFKADGVLPPPFRPVPDEKEDPAAWDSRRVGVMVPGGVVVGVRRPDGQWLRLATRGEHDVPERSLMPLIWLALVGAVITVPSIWTARRLVAPLERLAAAAERIGVDRSAPTIAEAGPMEFRTIAQAFNRMGARLKRFVDDRTLMIASISHDLRTSITRMRLRAEFVTDPEQQERMLRDLAEMEQMVTSTLAFASADAQTEKRALTDVAALIADICEDAAESGGNISYVGPYHASLPCQPMALRRAISNLVENALMHGAPPVQVTVTDEKDALLVDVVDHGLGVRPEDHDRVLLPFVRLGRSNRREANGAGLGLTIARTIIHAQGGSMTLMNVRPRGFQVRLLLPKSTQEAAASAYASEAAAKTQ